MNALGDVADLIDMELACLGRRDHLVLEHEVGQVGPGDDDALGTCQPFLAADIEIALHLLVHSANGLDLAFLVHRPGNRDALSNGQAGQTRENDVQFGGRGAVAIYRSIALFKSQADGDAQGGILGKGAPQVAA